MPDILWSTTVSRRWQTREGTVLCFVGTDIQFCALQHWKQNKCVVCVCVCVCGVCVCVCVCVCANRKLRLSEQSSKEDQGKQWHNEEYSDDQTANFAQ
jgi:hypothetical protein